MQAIHLRRAATLTLTIAAISATGSALASPSASPLPVRPVSAARPSLHMANLLLRTDDVPGLVTDRHARVGLSLWDSSERDTRNRAILRAAGWRGGAERTFGQQPFSLYGVLVIESRVLVFTSTDGARRALRGVAPAGLHRVSGRLPLAGGAGVYAHSDTVSGVAELALATQFRQRNVVSRVMIVGTPGLITRAHLLLTAQRQAMRVAKALPE